MNLKKPYGTVDREDLWRTQRKYGVRDRLLKAVKSFYKDSNVFVT